MIGNLEAIRQSVADAQDDAVRAVVRASADAAEGACEVTRFSTALGRAEQALTVQGQALQNTTKQSGEIAIAFGQTARAVQAPRRRRSSPASAWRGPRSK
jgi:hypothetical protein